MEITPQGPKRNKFQQCCINNFGVLVFIITITLVLMLITFIIMAGYIIQLSITFNSFVAHIDADYVSLSTYARQFTPLADQLIALLNRYLMVSYNISLGENVTYSF
jgi:hypothetical protein